MATISQATSAYANALNQVTKAPQTPSLADEGAGSGAFGDMLQQSLRSAVDAQHKSEKISGQALAGKADMTDVLQAVNDAEMALNTVLAVRDRVVQAYQELMRTSI